MLMHACVMSESPKSGFIEDEGLAREEAHEVGSTAGYQL